MSSVRSSLNMTRLWHPFEPGPGSEALTPGMVIPIHTHPGLAWLPRGHSQWLSHSRRCAPLFYYFTGRGAWALSANKLQLLLGRWYLCIQYHTREAHMGFPGTAEGTCRVARHGWLGTSAKLKNIHPMVLS